LFSTAGFTDELRASARTGDGSILLVSLEMLYKIRP
jgi:hypothetical protein